MLFLNVLNLLKIMSANLLRINTVINRSLAASETVGTIRVVVFIYIENVGSTFLLRVLRFTTEEHGSQRY